jgi:hypothetical protein
VKRTWKTSIKPEYREHRIEVVVRVHKSMPEENDPSLVVEVLRDIRHLASGNVVTIEATRKADQ